MKVKLTRLEQRMIISACKMLCQADKDCVDDYSDKDSVPSCNYGIIDKKMIERWKRILKKLRQAGNKDERSNA